MWTQQWHDQNYMRKNQNAPRPASALNLEVKRADVQTFKSSRVQDVQDVQELLSSTNRRQVFWRSQRSFRYRYRSSQTTLRRINLGRTKYPISFAHRIAVVLIDFDTACKTANRKKNLRKAHWAGDWHNTVNTCYLPPVDYSYNWLMPFS